MSVAASPALGAPDSWVAPLARAVPAIVLGVAITFSQDHSAALGLTAFGFFGVATAAVLLASAIRADRALRGTAWLHGIVTAVAGIAALAVPNRSLGVFILIVSAWAILSGALDTVNGVRFRTRRPVARDWLIGGVLTLALGAVFLLVPRDYSDPFRVEDKGVVVSGVVTADITLVGVLGAWAFILGALFAIAAVSLRAPRPEPAEVDA